MVLFDKKSSRFLVMTDLTSSVVIGTLFFAYVRLFNRTMTAYKNSQYTMTWEEYIHDSLDNYPFLPTRM